MSSEISFPKDVAFPLQEYERRISQVRQLMSERHLDAILTCSPSNICYLTGHHSVNLWDYQCLILALNGQPVLVLWQFELGRFQSSCRTAQAATYQTEDDPIAFTTQTLEKLGLRSSCLGMELTSVCLTVQLYQRLLAQLPQAKIENGSGIVESVRLVKSEDEIACLRRAAAITCSGMEAGIQAVGNGVFDSEVAAEATRRLLVAGSDFMCIEPIVAAGYRSGLAHSSFSRKRLESGESVFIELGACANRYTAPLMRTAVLGQPSEQLRRLAEASSRSIDAMVAVMKPGVIASEVAKAGKKAIEPVESQVVFHYVFGYSVGIGFPPSWLESAFYLRADNHRGLQAGMVFHLPMTLRIFGLCGVGFSETVLVTETGAEVLTTRMDRSLIVR